MLPDRVSNPGPLTYESGALPIALRGPAGAVVNGVTSNALRKVNTDLRKTFTNSFNWLYYVPVIVSGIREIEITIKEASGALATFLSQPVVVTLHFSKI